MSATVAGNVHRLGGGSIGGLDPEVTPGSLPRWSPVAVGTL
jgi:hypothetical protein